MDRHPRIQPAVYSISINGPYEANGPGDTPSRRQIFVCTPAKAGEEEGCAKRIVAKLMRRAYRRPVTDADLQVPLKFYREARTGGEFETGVEMALRAVLVSPEFLFRVEQDPSGVAPNTAYRMSDLELASRMSFFLWSSIPDDELLDAAIRGKLRTPACWNSRSGECWRMPVRAPGEQLCRSVAVPAQSGVDHSGYARVPRFRR